MIWTILYIVIVVLIGWMLSLILRDRSRLQTRAQVLSRLLRQERLLLNSFPLMVFRQIENSDSGTMTKDDILHALGFSKEDKEVRTLLLYTLRSLVDGGLLVFHDDGFESSFSLDYGYQDHLDLILRRG